MHFISHLLCREPDSEGSQNTVKKLTRWLYEQVSYWCQYRLLYQYIHCPPSADSNRSISWSLVWWKWTSAGRSVPHLLLFSLALLFYFSLALLILHPWYWFYVHWKLNSDQNKMNKNPHKELNVKCFGIILVVLKCKNLLI